jgi:17beta-estradiol 17-dehydrogenase/3alpha(17beta)-hydroxysteroid dehydrogenase (NAD+)
MLANKLALITGSGSGLGKACARLFAKNGANLVLIDTSPRVVDIARQIEAESSGKVKAYAAQCDVGDSEQIGKLFHDIRAAFPDARAPNVVVNSAGITRDALLLKTSERDFDEVVRVNLKGTFLITQAAARALAENITSSNLNLSSMQTYASIVNLSSVVGRFGNIGQANYAASKAGVEGFTRTTAKELGKLKIRCNSILAGFIKTPMTDKVPEKYINQIVKAVPLGRLGDPDDVAQLAMFLGSDASSYITGSSIECGGGISF